jgi:hypothetical protein
VIGHVILDGLKHPAPAPGEHGAAGPAGRLVARYHRASASVIVSSVRGKAGTGQMVVAPAKRPVDVTFSVTDGALKICI